MSRGWKLAAVAATHPPSSASPSATSTTSYADAGRICAALNALEYAGNTTAEAATTAEHAYRVTAADIARARRIRCPHN